MEKVKEMLDSLLNVLADAWNDWISGGNDSDEVDDDPNNEVDEPDFVGSTVINPQAEDDYEDDDEY